MTSLRPDRAMRRIEWLLLLLGVAFCLAQVAISWDRPLLDQHGFRQTQTALSVFWILKGGAWFAYPTPILGAPWSIPFEFPLYQWMVAIVAGNLHILTIDQAGRLVSEFFFLMCLWPLWRITSHHERGDGLFRLSAALLLFSPLYAFWSRSFMIESTVFFFSFWFLAALIDFRCRPSVPGFIEMTATAAVAACVKITTFFGFSIAGALVVVWSLLSMNEKERRGLSCLLPFAAIALSVIVSLLFLWGWVHYSDGLKSRNLLARTLTSDALTAWNFGNEKQRMSTGFLHAIFERAPGEALGFWGVPIVASLVVLIRPSLKRVFIYIALLLLYAVPFLVFTNLQLMHNYYQYANAVFLVLAVAYALFSLSIRFPVVALALTIMTVSIEIYGYSKYFLDDQTLPNRGFQAMLASYTKKHTQPGDVIVGFGLRWSAEVPYYSQRRAILVAYELVLHDPLGVLKKLASDPLKYTAGHPVGAVIVCPNNFASKGDANGMYRALFGAKKQDTSAAFKTLLNSLTKGKSARTVGYCVVYS